LTAFLYGRTGRVNRVALFFAWHGQGLYCNMSGRT
jgi:hypothetical protein